jgi:Ribonuclease G/E
MKRGRDAFKERLKHDDEIQNLKKLSKKREVQQSYTKIIRSKSNSKSRQELFPEDESHALNKYLNASDTYR